MLLPKPKRLHVQRVEISPSVEGNIAGAHSSLMYIVYMLNLIYKF
jgi:hypothetical protein